MNRRKRRDWMRRWLAWPELVVMLIMIGIFLALLLPYACRN